MVFLTFAVTLGNFPGVISQIESMQQTEWTGRSNSLLCISNKALFKLYNAFHVTAGLSISALQI